MWIDDHGREWFEEMVRNLVLLGDHGGLSGSTYLPDDARVQLVEAEIAGSSGSWEFALAGIDARVVTTIRNCLAYSHYSVTALEQAVVRAGFHNAAAKTFPSGSCDPLPFATDVALDSDDVSIMAEFAGRPHDLVSRRVEQVLGAWYEVSAIGGFGPDIREPSRPLADVEQDVQWLNNELWLHLTNAAFDEEALDALLNALAGVHARVAPIVRVEIQ